MVWRNLTRVSFPLLPALHTCAKWAGGGQSFPMLYVNCCYWYHYCTWMDDMLCLPFLWQIVLVPSLKHLCLLKMLNIKPLLIECPMSAALKNSSNPNRIQLSQLQMEANGSMSISISLEPTPQSCVKSPLHRQQSNSYFVNLLQNFLH